MTVVSVTGVLMVQVLWNRIRIHASIRKLFQMTLKVDFEVSFRCETVSTDVALERTFT